MPWLVRPCPERTGKGGCGLLADWPVFWFGHERVIDWGCVLAGAISPAFVTFLAGSAGFVRAGRVSCVFDTSELAFDKPLTVVLTSQS